VGPDAHHQHYICIKDEGGLIHRFFMIWSFLFGETVSSSLFVMIKAKVLPLLSSKSCSSILMHRIMSK
jgi:hypothetical protein